MQIRAGVGFLLLLAMVSCLTGGLYAQSRTIPSTDLLPLGDWTYDAMGSLSADGLSPTLPARVFQGDRLFGRVEMAQAVAEVVRSSRERTLTWGQAALIRNLVLEFEPEFRMLGEEIPNSATESFRVEPLLLGYARAMPTLREESGSGDSTDIHLAYRVSGYVPLSRTHFGIVTISDNEERFMREMRDSALPDKAFVRGFEKDYTWSLGREYLNWGPAYSGSLTLSSNAPPFWQARAGKDIDFGNLVGKVKITQFVGSFEDDGKQLHLLGRRCEKPISGVWHLGISEAAKMSTTPNPLILVMPFYAYQHIFHEVDAEFNAVYGADLTYRTRNGLSAYGEIVIDDMTSPGIFGGGFERPQKAGFLAGVRIPRVFGNERYSGLTVEYILVDRLTYTATRPEAPEMSYTHDGQVIGHPIGPNAKAVYIRGERSLGERLSLIAEYLDQRQKDSGPPQRGRATLYSFLLAYDAAPDRSLALRIAPFSISEPGGVKEEGVTYELRASYAF